MAGIEERLAKVEQKLDDVAEKVSFVHDFIMKLDEKHAGKWVEKFVIAAMLLAVAALITG